MEAQYTLASVLFVLGPSKDILTSGGSPEVPLPCSQPYTEAVFAGRKEMADALPKNPLLPAPAPPPPPKPALSPPVLSSFLFFLSFFILPAEHLPAGHSISFLVFGE